MLFSAKNEDYSATEWTRTESAVSKLRKIRYQQTIYGCCGRYGSTRLHYRMIIVSIIALLLLLFIWKNIPVLLPIGTSPKELCPPPLSCGQHEREDENPDITLDYAAEVDERLLHDDEHTTVGPPPILPDHLYMANWSEPRAKMHFSVVPDKVVESIYALVDGASCVHMVQKKMYNAKFGIVIFVKSKTTNFDRRVAIRSTWGQIYFLNQIRIEKVFVLGQVDDPAAQENLQKEVETFGDILQFEGPDDYRNMPIKVTSAMQWAAENLPADYFYASTDDDFVVNFGNLVDFLEYEIKLKMFLSRKTDPSITRELVREKSPIYCVYYFDKVKGPNRDNSSKWYVSKEEYSLERYPPYCGGGFYIMSIAMAKDLYDISRVTKILPMDDVWITGILRQKLGQGDDNVVKAEWPKKDDQPLWKHLWGDYGRKKNVAKLLPPAWHEWNRKVANRPHCTRNFDASTVKYVYKNADENT
ncbi:unnamed protein product [Clavelina lepadiformis]|uniref:Hexosyltransferase n=1 Tax=Clavelina lepadiformis TaxID=159417 RepID=A0ABP0GRH6_CLALP